MDIQWSLVLFTALTGMGGWLFFFICLNVFVRKTDKGAFAGTATALALTVVGGLASVTHLSHPDRMLGALQHPTSGIFTEALLVGLLAIVMIAFLVMLRRGIDGGALKAVAVVGMALGALMSFMAGQSYLMSAIAAWNTELLPLGYLGTAAASGAAAYLVLIAAQKADENACSLYGLMTLAADLGLKVESRPVEAEELSTFSEAGACGLVGVISPIGSIYDPETNHTYTYNNGEPGEWSKKLYHKLRAIQYGEEPDTHGWNLVLE